MIVGREAEIAVVDRLLERAQTGCATLLVEGEAGIGKTTLFQHSLDVARHAGFMVLASRPAGSESGLALTAIGDLLEAAVPEGRLADLPAAQRHAIEVVLGERVPEAAVGERSIGAGLRSLVDQLAQDRPGVLLALDDAQWLDVASARTLTFAIRRLGAARVAVLLMRRSGDPGPLDPEALGVPGTLVRLRLEALGEGALGRLLAERLGRAPTRAVVRRLHAASGGNPLFAIEAGRLVGDDGLDSAQPLAVPDDLQTLVAERVAGLPRATADVLLAAALLPQARADVLERAFPGSLRDVIGPAADAGVARVCGDAVRFEHPLHAAAVVAAATPAERRRAHAVLAEHVEGAGDRALHLAYARDEPDPQIADLVEAGAGDIARRGGLQVAAEMLDRAWALTPEMLADARVDRALHAAELYARAGEPRGAEAAIERALGGPLDDGSRAVALRLLGELRWSTGDFAESGRLLLDAVELAASPLERVRIMLNLCYQETLRGDQPAAEHWARRAVHELAPGEHPGPEAEALAYWAMTKLLAGMGLDERALQRALELEDPDRVSAPGASPRAAVALVLMVVGRLSEARELNREVIERLTASGDDRDLANVYIWRCWLEAHAADFPAASAAIEAAIHCATLNADESVHGRALAQRAWLNAYRGDRASVERDSEAALARAESGGLVEMWVCCARAMAALADDDHEAAWAVSRPAAERAERDGVLEPAIMPTVIDAAEALIALEEPDRAEALLDVWDARAEELGRNWAVAAGLRARALLLAARGDMHGAIDAAQRGLAVHGQLEQPFETARMQLVCGRILRRARRRAAAREMLSAARDGFETLGAELWAQSARRELERVSRAGAREPSGLTPSEQQVAALAGEGLSNKEIARMLRVSVHTVEVHLSRVYAKLGISGRTKLRGRLGPVSGHG